MGAPAKFLFDVDFASGADRKPGGATITLAEHAIKLAEAEAAARRMADALERIAVNLGKANDALQAIETRLECEAVEVVVAVARKLVPTLIAREPFAEIATLASDCFRELVSSPHIAGRVHDRAVAPAPRKT